MLPQGLSLREFFVWCVVWKIVGDKGVKLNFLRARFVYICRRKARKCGGLDVEAVEATEEVEKEQVRVTGWSMKRREGRRYLMKKKISGKAIAAIIAALAVVGIAVYMISSTSKQVVNIDISGYNEMTITSGGTGKIITPNEEQRMHISSLVKNMNLKAKKFPQTKGWGYCITYYKDGVANTIVLAGKVTWNGADYKVDKESYDKLKEYIDTLYK